MHLYSDTINIAPPNLLLHPTVFSQQCNGGTIKLKLNYTCVIYKRMISINYSPHRWFAVEWCQTSPPAVRSHSRPVVPRCCNLPAGDSISVSRGARKGSLRQRTRKIECQSGPFCDGPHRVRAANIIATLVRPYLRKNTREKIPVTSTSDVLSRK